MKFTCSQNNFLEAVLTVQKLYLPDPALPYWKVFCLKPKRMY